MSVVIGSVPYLNEKPLTRWFTHTEEGRASGIEVVYAVPSQLAVMLKSGEIAAALVSSFEYFRTPGYGILPGVSISSQDEILAVRAFSRLPWKLTTSVALDTSSLTSVALLKILLAEQHHIYPSYLHHAPDLPAMLEVADAALLIGDKGMLANNEGLFTLDLGEAWRKLTGLPFVFAIWLGDPDRVTPDLIRALKTAKAWGLTQLDLIAEEQAEVLNCPKSLCLRYLTEIMDYDLGEDHLAALEEFGLRARRVGLLDQAPAPLHVLSSRR
ncbi:chorismate dehydratase [Capsulimonas corticalis]|uniref:Chorismate dehydratase n=1 Tax=Capsulimonas corticalis TaxID=2219043 RepID=A0A402CXV8_9BACT|nr:menaquinone biosynthesis protein [Capsulimonas corticalis]BDI32153.1 chorismate dehydratase [Capsulimonas corticalis]